MILPFHHSIPLTNYNQILDGSIECIIGGGVIDHLLRVHEI